MPHGIKQSLSVFKIPRILHFLVSNKFSSFLDLNCNVRIGVLDLNCNVRIGVLDLNCNVRIGVLVEQ
jgi:hypothetical protein